MVRYAAVVLFLLPLLTRVPVTSRAQEACPLPTGAAIATPVSPSTGITTETLAEVRLPAAAIPASPAIVDVWLATLAPGEAIAFATRASPPSIVADVVLGGALIVRSAGRVLVQRAEGLKEVPPNTVVTIHPDEAIIYVDNQAAQSFRNPGRGTLTAISFGVFSSAPPSTFTAGPVNQQDWARSGLAGRDLTVAVDRLTVPPGASLPAFVPDVRAPRVFVVAEGMAQAVVTTTTGAALPPAERFGPGQVIGFRTLGEGERLQVRNAGVRPLVLLQVTLGAAHAATPVAGPDRPRKWSVTAPGTVLGLAAARRCQAGVPHAWSLGGERQLRATHRVADTFACPQWIMRTGTP